MKKSAVNLALAFSLAAIAACSDDTVGGSTTVDMRAEMSTARVAKVATAKGDDATTLNHGATVDSLKVSRVRVLVSRIKLHTDKSDTNTGDKDVKTGPMLITIDSAGTRSFTTATIDAGSYDKVKFEFHRFSSSEVPTYLADTTYADFVTDDRYTFIIDGTAYTGGTAFPFTYRSDATANLSLKFDPSLTLSSGSTTIIVLQFDPLAIFKDGGEVLDPRDGKNESHIDNAIKSAIKALKK